MKLLSALARAKGRGVAWLALAGIIASGCSDPYEAEAQFWPADLDGSGTAGSLSQHTGGSATSGSPAVPMGSNDAGGTTASTTGGALGASGAAPSTAGGTNTAGSSAAGGAGNLGGSASGGSSGGSGGSGSLGNAGSPAGGSTSSLNCSLTVKVTTAAAGGKYAPRNIGAIWVADQSGTFIRSLEVWAQRRVNHLTQWNSATSKAGAPGSRVDIVSQATLSSHKAHTATWNCQDFKKASVPDGTYRVYFEMTDNSATGPNRFETFTKGPAAVTLNPTDNNNFKAIELSFKP